MLKTIRRIYYRKSDLIIASILSLFTFLLYYPFVLISIDFQHHGLLMATSYALSKGSVLFRDIFYQYGALSAYIHFSSFRLFGESLYSIQFITLLFFPIITFFFYRLSRFFLSRFESVLIVLLWIFSAYFFYWGTQPGSHTFSLVFTVIATFYALISFKKQKEYMLLSGIFSALAFFSRQTVGLFYSLSLLSFLFLYIFKSETGNRKIFLRLLLYYIIGLFIPVVLFLAYFWKKSALNDWWLDTFGFSYLWGKEYGQGYNMFTLIRIIFPVSISIVIRKIIKISLLCLLLLAGLKTGSIRRKVFFWLISFFIFLQMVIFTLQKQYLITNYGDPVIPLILALVNCLGILIVLFNILLPKHNSFNLKNGPFLLIIFVSVAAWTQYYPLNDPVHTFYSIPLMLILGGIGLKWLINKIVRLFFPGEKNKSYLAPLLYFLVAFLLFIPGGFPRLWRGYNKLTALSDMKMINDPPILRGVYETPEKTEEIKRLSDQLKELRKTHPGIQVRIIGDEPLALTLLPDNRIPKIFFDYAESYNAVFPKYLQKQLDAIKNEPTIVVVNGKDYLKAQYFADLLNYQISQTYPAIRQTVLLPK